MFSSQLFPAIEDYCNELYQEFSLIPADRLKRLHELSQYIVHKNAHHETIQIVVICTHNSRRSHFGQIWMSVAANYYHFPNIHAFSGGTDVTAFHPSALAALQRIGFQIETNDQQSANPDYFIKWKNDMEGYRAFSKKYDDSFNPQSKFAAILVCSEADAACPIVYGCEYRLALPYNDPKSFDGTELEREQYDACCRQIGRELLYAFGRAIL